MYNQRSLQFNQTVNIPINVSKLFNKQEILHKFTTNIHKCLTNVESDQHSTSLTQQPDAQINQQVAH